MRSVLILAGVYNLAWGAFVALWPHFYFDWLDIERPNYPQLWQCIGMIVGIYGFLYLVAANDPFLHWHIVFVGLLGKVLGPLGFLASWLVGDFPFRFGVVLLTNDLPWWPFFVLILLAAWRRPRRRSTPAA
jgi:hypothetical protein